jgi:hypothetical protein
MVQATCFPSGVNTLVIPIFFPINPFIFYWFAPGVQGQSVVYCQPHLRLILISIPCLQPTFSVSHRSFSEGGLAIFRFPFVIFSDAHLRQSSGG